MRIERSRFALERRHEDGGQLLQCGKLIGGEEALPSFRDQIGLCNGKLPDFVRLLRRLASGRVGLRGGGRRLPGGRVCLACDQGSGGGRGQ